MQRQDDEDGAKINLEHAGVEGRSTSRLELYNSSIPSDDPFDVALVLAVARVLAGPCASRILPRQPRPLRPRLALRQKL